MKYRIDFYDGWSVYDGLISREYHKFNCVDDAKIYAMKKMQEMKFPAFSIQEVR